MVALTRKRQATVGSQWPRIDWTKRQGIKEEACMYWTPTCRCDGFGNSVLHPAGRRVIRYPLSAYKDYHEYWVDG